MVTVRCSGLTRQSMKETGHIIVLRVRESFTIVTGMYTMVSGMIIELRAMVFTLLLREQDTKALGTTIVNMARVRRLGWTDLTMKVNTK